MRPCICPETTPRPGEGDWPELEVPGPEGSLGLPTWLPDEGAPRQQDLPEAWARGHGHPGRRLESWLGHPCPDGHPRSAGELGRGSRPSVPQAHLSSCPGHLQRGGETSCLPRENKSAQTHQPSRQTQQCSRNLRGGVPAWREGRSRASLCAEPGPTHSWDK